MKIGIAQLKIQMMKKRPNKLGHRKEVQRESSK